MWSREFVIHYLSDKLNLFLNIEYYSAKFLMRLKVNSFARVIKIIQFIVQCILCA